MRRPFGRRRPTGTVAFPGTVRRPEHPRLAPARPGELGVFNTIPCTATARLAGTQTPNVFTTLGRHRRLFRAWLRFATRLMPFGRIDRADAERQLIEVCLLIGHYEMLAVTLNTLGVQPECPTTAQR
jgi:hypothetical protein